MRIVALILAAVTFLHCSSDSLARPSYTVAVGYPSPPFAYTDNAGTLAGFDVDMANALCAQMKARCAIVPMRFDDIIPALVSGGVDFALANMAMTEERARLIHFSESYHSSHAVFVEHVGAAAPIDLHNLNGKRIGVLKGTVHEQYLQETYAGIVVPHVSPTLDELFLDLENDKVDLILIDSVAASAFLRTPSGVEMEEVGQPLVAGALGAPSHIGISPKRPELAQKLNNALNALRCNGNYGRITRKYFNTIFN